MSKEKDIFIPDIFESGDIPFFQIKYYENSEELQFEKLT